MIGKETFKPLTEEQFDIIKDNLQKKKFKVKFIIEQERIIKADNYQQARELMGCTLFDRESKHPEIVKHEVTVYVEDIESKEKFLHKNFEWNKINKKIIDTKFNFTLEDLNRALMVRLNHGTGHNWNDWDDVFNCLGEYSSKVRDIIEGKKFEIIECELIKKCALEWGFNEIILAKTFNQATKEQMEEVKD